MTKFVSASSETRRSREKGPANVGAEVKADESARESGVYLSGNSVGGQPDRQKLRRNLLIAFASLCVCRPAFGQPAPPPLSLPPPAPIILFDQNKVDLSRVAPLIIKQVAEEFGVLNDPRIEVRGHADKSEIAGQALSQLRAQIVKEALMSAGIPDGAITTSSFGATRPLVVREDGWSAALNRSVEIITFWTAGATAYFDWGQSELSPTAVETTKQFAEKYRNRTDGLIKVIGHSNKAEPDAIGLSLRRAGAVVKVLVTEGVSTSSIVLRGTGGDDQVYPEISGKIEPKNRQVEVTFARR